MDSVQEYANIEQYSVLMSVYAKENEEYFRLAIESMLNQTVPPSDFVLVCDGPLTPDLDSVIEAFCQRKPSLFHVLRLPENRGLGLALAAGLPVCRYEFVARMDTDDISLPDRVERQLKVISGDPDLAVVGGQIAEFRGTSDNIIGYRKVPLTAEEIRKCSAGKNPMNHMTVLFRKPMVLAVGGYQHFPFFEDYHLWSRMLADGQKMQNIEDVCCYVRTDEGLYRRRGGMNYFRCTLAMERSLKELGLISGVRFLLNVITRFIGTVVLPERMRAYLYTKLMRKAGVNN